MSIRQQYVAHGVERYYAEHSDAYANPHSEQIAHLVRQHSRCWNPTDRILDLCCGDGAVTQTLQLVGFNNIDGCDPFLYKQYVSKTQRTCHKYNFADIARGDLTDTYDIIICSFALHLCPKDLLNVVLYQLARIAPNLVVISPSKKVLVDTFCWRPTCHTIYNRVHLRQFERIGVCLC